MVIRGTSVGVPLRKAQPLAGLLPPPCAGVRVGGAGLAPFQTATGSLWCVGLLPRPGAARGISSASNQSKPQAS